MQRRGTDASVLDVHASIKHPVPGLGGEPGESVTLARERQREAENLALAEAFGAWLSDLTGHDVRGAEGCYEDLEDGVVVCRMLLRLGIPVGRWKESPRNQFERKENWVIFQEACKSARFKCIPTIGAATPSGIVPTLLEAAAVAAAQHRYAESSPGNRASLPAALPAALSKRTEDAGQGSAVVAAARAGDIRAEETPSPVETISSENPKEPEPVSEPITTIESDPPENLVPAAGLLHATRAGGGRASSSAGTKRVAFDTPASSVSADVVSSTEPVVLLKEASLASAPATTTTTRSSRARTTSEIPQEEKDRMVNLFLAAFLGLILVYVLVLR